MDVRVPIVSVRIVIQVRRIGRVAAWESKTESLSSGNQDGRLSVTTLRRNERQSAYRQYDQQKFFHSFLPFVSLFCEGGTVAKTFHDVSRCGGLRGCLGCLARFEPSKPPVPSISKNRGVTRVRAGFGVSPSHGSEKAAEPPAMADWGRLGALAGLEAGLFVESVSLPPNRDCWQRNYKAARIGVNRAADVLSSFLATVEFGNNLADLQSAASADRQFKFKKRLWESLESFRESQHAQGNRLTRNSPSETVAPRNRSLVIDPHADRFG